MFAKFQSYQEGTLFLQMYFHSQIIFMQPLCLSSTAYNHGTCRLIFFIPPLKLLHSFSKLILVLPLVLLLNQIVFLICFLTPLLSQGTTC